jgi:hypothetical protein
MTRRRPGAGGAARATVDLVPLGATKSTLGRAARPRVATFVPAAQQQACHRLTSGYPVAMEAEVHVREVEAVETRSGKTRYVLRDDEGREFTTFRPAIGSEAAKFEGRRAVIEFHEEERNGFRNVYLDAIREAPEQQPAGGETDPDEVGWATAVEAAPWMLGSNEPERAVPPEELFEKLEPFKRLVAEDIRESGEDRDDD